MFPIVFGPRPCSTARVKVNGFDVVFEAAVFDQRGSSRLRGDVEDKYAATEQVIPDYLLRIARGTEEESCGPADFRDPRHGAAQVRHAARYDRRRKI